MLNFRLFVDNQQMIEFITNRPTISVDKLKLEDNILQCHYKYIDKYIINMIFNCDQYLPLAISLDLSPEYVDNLSSIIIALTKNAPDFRFFYIDPPGREEYMVQFEFDSQGVNGKIRKVKMVNIASLNTIDQDLQTLDTRIDYFKNRQASLEVLTKSNTEDLEKVRKNIEDLRKQEHTLSMEADSLTLKITEARQKLGQKTRHEDALRELQHEKERLSSNLAKINREQILNKKEVLESLAKRYDSLKSDMVEELNKSLNEYIESEKKHKATLRAMLDKQAKCDSECKLGLYQTKTSSNWQKTNSKKLPGCKR